LQLQLILGLTECCVLRHWPKNSLDECFDD
jgi:hypothetical protein